MKNLLALIILPFTTTVLLANNNLAVQVIAVENQDSISAPFMRIVNSLTSNNIKHTVSHEGKWTKIKFQSFSTKNDALKFCKIAREQLADDAFITKSSTKPMKKDVSSKTLKSLATLASFESTNCLCNNSFDTQNVEKRKDSKRQKRESEISTALKYYKNSKFYSF